MTRSKRGCMGPRDPALPRPLAQQSSKAPGDDGRAGPASGAMHQTLTQLPSTARRVALDTTEEAWCPCSEREGRAVMSNRRDV